MEKSIAEAVFRELSDGWDTPTHIAGEILLRGGRLAWNEDGIVHGNMRYYKKNFTENDLEDFVIRCRERGLKIHDNPDLYGGRGWVLDKSLVTPLNLEPIDLDEFRAFVERNPWKEAKTAVSYAPHEYVVRNRLTAGEKVNFDRVTKFIRDNGFPASFFSEKRMYYILDEHYYWTMGAPVIVTTILNRARCDEYTLSDGKWFWKKPAKPKKNKTLDVFA